MTNRKAKPIFPDINPFLCPEKMVSLTEADLNYRKALMDTQLTYNIEYANKLSEYQNIYNPKNLVPIKKDFDQFISHMKKWKRSMGYDFLISFQKRKKGYIKFNEKVRLFIEKSLNANTELEREKYSLDRICDEIGIRLILPLGKEDTHETVSLCYEVLKEVNHFFTFKKGYFPINAEPLLDLGFKQEKFPKVIIPTEEESQLSDELKIKVKDYYKTPKENSYQSLHIAYSSSLYGLPFEVQIRTMATHTRVEYECSMHNLHDKKRYHDRIEIDREHINLYGYQFVNENIEDLVGLEKAIDPFSLIY